MEISNNDYAEYLKNLRKREAELAQRRIAEERGKYKARQEMLEKDRKKDLEQRSKTSPKKILEPYELIEWEGKKDFGIDNSGWKFNPSQERLEKAGYKRHPTSAEWFSLVCAYLDDKKNKTSILTPELTKVAEDMVLGDGEKFCQAYQTIKKDGKNNLLIYEYVTDFPFPAGTLNIAYFKEPTIKTFDISDLILDQTKWSYFKDIYPEHDDLIQYLTSRNFNDLPEQIKQKGRIFMSDMDKEIWMLVSHSSNYNLFGIQGHGGMASRGIHDKICRVTGSNNAGHTLFP